MIRKTADTASTRRSSAALPFLCAILSFSAVCLVVAMSCLASGFVVASGGVGNNNNMQEKVTKNLRTRLDAVHTNDIDCNTCVRVNEFLHAELVEMEEETNVDAIENEEELAKHHAKEMKTRKRKLLHGRSEPKIRDTVLHACVKCADYDRKKTYYLQDHDCDACHVILFGGKERGRVLLEGKDGEVEEDERRLDHAFHALVDHTFELGTPELQEMVDFLCVPHFCRVKEVEQRFSGGFEGARHEEL